MPKAINKISAQIRQITLRLNPDTDDIQVFVEYLIVTDEGLSGIRTLNRLLSGNQKAQTRAFLNNLQSEVNTQEGL